MADGNKACPFCGGRRQTVRPVWERYWYWFVACNNCRAAGPVAKSQDEAWRLWNERRYPMPTQGELF